MTIKVTAMNQRFRGYLPVVIDIETAGFDPQYDALLEIGAVILELDENGIIKPAHTLHEHVIPFPGANLDPAALEFTGIDPDHPFRFAKTERKVLLTLFDEVFHALKKQQCQRAVLVGHNPAFDISFLNAAIARCSIKNNPFHKFTTFDTATLSALAFGQTVLAKSVAAAGIAFDPKEAHSALYDAEKTAALFCNIINNVTYR